MAFRKKVRVNRKVRKRFAKKSRLNRINYSKLFYRGGIRL